MKPNDADARESEASQAKQDSTSNPMMRGMGMMKKVMAGMGGGESPMAMMQKMMGGIGGPKEGEAGNPMQNMMGMCMGMCSEMLFAINKTASMAALATPELRNLFDEWMESLECEALAVFEQHGEMDAATLAATLKISEESAVHLMAQMTKKGKTVLRAAARKDTET